MRRATALPAALRDGSMKRYSANATSAGTTMAKAIAPGAPNSEAQADDDEQREHRDGDATAAHEDRQPGVAAARRRAASSSPTP